MPGPTIFLSATEVSADLHGADLIRAIRARSPSARIVGLGGPAMIREGLECRRNMLKFAVMLADFVDRIPAFIRLWRETAREFRASPPDVFVPIDSPGIHLVLARSATRAGVPVAYYVCPQIWAWGAWRVHKIRNRVDRMLTLFKFEGEVLRRGDVPHAFVGHPLVDRIEAFRPDPGFLESVGAQGTLPVALFPGSRIRVLAKNLPVMARAAARIQRSLPDACFLVPAPDEELQAAADAVLSAEGVRHRTFLGRSFDALAACRLALVSSGTGALEAALFDRPTVVVYGLAAFDWVMQPAFVRLDRISLPNILAGDGIVPEFVSWRISAEAVAQAALRLLSDPAAREAQRQGFERVRGELGPPGAAGRAAEEILEVARKGRKGS